MRANPTLLLLIGIFLSQVAHSQDEVGYEKQYDEPYGINKLWVHFQPIYGEVSSSNTTIGFGIEADYMHENLFDINLHGRLPYARSMDLMRDAATKNGDNTDSPVAYRFFELGGTYHWKDMEIEKDDKVFLYEENLKGNQWASKVIQTTKIKARMRRIYGARLGFVYYASTFDLSRILENQGVTLTDPNGEPIPADLSLFTNEQMIGLNVGASYSTIRNFAVNYEEKYNPSGDDLIFDVFFDILIAPSMRIDDITYNGIVYSTDNVETNKIGFRVGVDGKFNRTLGWAYGFETGVRPAVKGGGFFATLKLSFPVYSTNLESSKVESVEQGDSVNQ